MAKEILAFLVLRTLVSRRLRSEGDFNLTRLLAARLERGIPARGKCRASPQLYSGAFDRFGFLVFLAMRHLLLTFYVLERLSSRYCPLIGGEVTPG